MGDHRTVFSSLNDAAVGLVFTTQIDDRTFDGAWSRPNVPLIIFSDHTLDGTAVTHNGGPMAGAHAGHPIDLVFWGSWWNSPPGKTRRTLIMDRTRALIDSPYFSMLAQYGVQRAPIWGKAITVTRPAAPQSAATLKDSGRAMVDLIDDLIDDSVYPDPDDGPRRLFVVLMPDGWTLMSADAIGAHRSSYDIDFPFDSDRYWAGWVGPRPNDPEFTMSILSHEVVEMMTDPEHDAWHTEKKSQINEVSDAGFSGGVTQTALVNDVLVQSYWSQLHQRTVIPCNTDHAARLRARISGAVRRVIDKGTFRPPESDSAACSLVRECCIEDREFSWHVHGIDETAQIRIEANRYRTPVTSWRIQGQPVSESGSVTFPAEVEEFPGGVQKLITRDITVDFTASGTGLDIRTQSVGGNFELYVACEVRDGSITGNVQSEPVATPGITIGFVGAQFVNDPAYVEQRSACLSALTKMFDLKYQPLGKIGPDEEIHYHPGELTRDLPAYVRPSRYGELRWMERALRAANALLPRREAATFVRGLSDRAHALSFGTAIRPEFVKHREREQIVYEVNGSS